MLALSSQTIVASLKRGLFQPPHTKAPGDFRGQFYDCYLHSLCSLPVETSGQDQLSEHSKGHAMKRRHLQNRQGSGLQRMEEPGKGLNHLPNLPFSDLHMFDTQQAGRGCRQISACSENSWEVWKVWSIAADCHRLDFLLLCGSVSHSVVTAVCLWVCFSGYGIS